MEDLKNREFISSPNLKYNSIIKTTDCCFGINDIFDIYYAQNENNELYLISADENFTIAITRIRDNKFVKSLGNNNEKIRMIRHFNNKNNNIDYLIVSFNKCLVKIWDLTNNYNLIHSFKIEYSENAVIYSCLLYFSKNNGDYIITSSNESDNNDYTKIYDFNDRSLIKNLEKTNLVDIFYLLLWNKNNDIEDDYLIQCSHSSVLIHSLKTKEEKCLLKAQNSTIHNSACIIKQKDVDYLYVVNVNGKIHIWNLNDFALKGIIIFKKSYFYHIINWNNKYIIVAEKSNGLILIIDTTCDKVVTVLSNIDGNFVNSLKKIYHPKYGESLLSYDFSKKIILWSQ